MLRFVEHRIKNYELRAGFDDLLNFFRYFRSTAPDRHARPEIRVLIALSEPVANAFFTAGLVIIYRHINALAVSKRPWIPLCLLDELANLRRFSHKGIRRR